MAPAVAAASAPSAILPLTLSPIQSILPSQATDTSTPIPLTSIDHSVVFLLDIVYFYPNPNPNPSSSSSSSDHHFPCEQLVPKLRQALSDILVPYHFLAGRLALNPSNGMLELDCGRQGALFASASCTDLALADLGDLTHPNPAFRSLVLEAPLQNAAIAAPKMTDAPLLMVQVTEFKCGGFALGFSTNHSVFDARGTMEFMMNLASVCRGEGLVVEPRPRDRSLLMPRNPPRSAFDHPEILKPCDTPKSGENPFTTAEVAHLDFSTVKLSHTHVFKSFPISALMLDKLKEAALEPPSMPDPDNTAALHDQPSRPLVTKCSSFDAIAAHVWQAWTKAVDMDDDALAKVLFAVDIRERLQPPLPAGFVGVLETQLVDQGLGILIPPSGVKGFMCLEIAGNALLSGFACVPSKDLKEGSLGFAVKKIREASDTLTNDYIRSTIDFHAIHGGGIPNLPGGICLSAWWKIPFFLCDFGFGRPVFAGPVVGGSVSFVLLLPNGTQHGLNVYIGLEPSQMEKFERLLYGFLPVLLCRASI